MTELTARHLDVGIGDVTVTTGLEFTIRPGENWGLLGRNGVGKTTLLNCLAGLIAPVQGNVLAGNTNVHTGPRREVARKLGMLEQHTVYHFDATVEQIALTGRHPHLAPWEREQESDFTMARASLATLDLVGFEQRGVTSLSGGEARRVAIAALLVQDPQVMLLDEPTNHLDLAHQSWVMELISNRVRSGNCCSLAALHDVNLASRYCSHVLLLLGDGNWLAGRTSEVLSKSTVERLFSCVLEEFEVAGHRAFYPLGPSPVVGPEERSPS